MLFHVTVDGQPRWATGAPDTGPDRLLAGQRLDDLLASAGSLADWPDEGPLPAGTRLLPPVESQPVWAAGVTFQRSRSARTEESATPDVYDLVYSADRPELFVKALPGMVRGPGGAVTVRADSTWDVPEPEVGLLINAAGRIVALVLGDDVSSRSIEGDNPLYLPQAKVYDGSCALGPGLLPIEDAPAWPEITVRLVVRRDERVIVDDESALRDMVRRPDELVRWLYRGLTFPVGAVLLTGTSLVPPAEFTLLAGDEVSISATGLGELITAVESTKDEW